MHVVYNMRLYKMEVYVYDFEDTDPTDVIESIESNRYRVVRVLKSEDIGLDWHDGHELNHTLDLETHRKYFGKQYAKTEYITNHTLT